MTTAASGIPRLAAWALAILILGAGLLPVAAANVQARIGYPDGEPIFYRLQEFQLRDATQSWPAGCYHVQRTWDFGDGTVSHARDPRHVYRELGQFMLRLTIEFADCPYKMVAADKVEVVDHPPIPLLDPMTGPVTAGQWVLLNATRSRDPDGVIVRYVFSLAGVDQPAATQGQYLVRPTEAGRQTAGVMVWDAAGNPSPRPATVMLDVLPARTVRLTLTPRDVVVLPGETVDFGVVGADPFGNPTAVSEPMWDATCGEFEAPGTFAAPHIAGVCHVSVRYEDGYANTTVRVDSGPVTSLVVNPPSAEMVVGTVQKFAAFAVDADGNQQVIDAQWSATCGDVTPEGDYTAVTTIGVCTLTAIKEDLRANSTIVSKASSLARVDIEPPYVVLRGHETQLYVARGFDVYENPVHVEAIFMSDCGYFAEAGLFVAPDVDMTCHIAHGSEKGDAVAVISNADPPVPELGPLALAGLGLVAVTLWARRRAA